MRYVALNEDVDGRKLVDAVVPAEQIVIEPAQLEIAVLVSRLRPVVTGHVIHALVRVHSHHQMPRRVVLRLEQRVGVIERAARVIVPAGQ